MSFIEPNILVINDHNFERDTDRQTETEAELKKDKATTKTYLSQRT